MEITHIRFKSNAFESLSKLYIDGKHIGYVIEDEYREVKVAGETRIPAGRYEIKLRYEGGMFTRYSARFGYPHPMIWIQDIPNFTYVYYHVGNTEKDTDGCPVIGKTFHIDGAGRMAVQTSVDTYLPFHKKIVTLIQAGEQVFTTIVDVDREHN